MDMKSVTPSVIPGFQAQQYGTTAGKAELSDTNVTNVTNEGIGIGTARDLLHKDKYQLSIADEALVKAIEKANKALAGAGTRFEYTVHEKTNDIIVKVINKETDQIIREIPSEKLVDLVAKLQEICGIIIDEKR